MQMSTKEQSLSDLDQQQVLEWTADIVSSFVSNNAVHAGDLADLIAMVHSSLKGIAEPKPPAAPPQELIPAVSIKKSVTNEYLICLEDGKHFKSLKRHLQSAYGLTPDEYRAKWGLSRDYPMVAPAYAAARSQLAKESGLGIPRKLPEPVVVALPPPPAPVKAAPAARAPAQERVVAPEPVAEAPAKRRGRPKKAA
jgi:predicted transcriptional regulator